MHSRLAILLLLCSCATAQTIHFTHGQWFDGTALTATDFYSINGILSHTAPSQVDETVDLHDAFIIPPNAGSKATASLFHPQKKRPLH